MTLDGDTAIGIALLLAALVFVLAQPPEVRARMLASLRRREDERQ